MLQKYNSVDYNLDWFLLQLANVRQSSLVGQQGYMQGILRLVHTCTDKDDPIATGHFRNFFIEKDPNVKLAVLRYEPLTTDCSYQKEIFSKTV